MGKIIKENAKKQPIVSKPSKRTVVYYAYFQGITRKAGFVVPPSGTKYLGWIEDIYPSMTDENKMKHVLYYAVSSTKVATKTWETENKEKVKR